MRPPHRATELKQTLKKLNLWGKTTVDKSAWIKAYMAVQNFVLGESYLRSEVNGMSITFFGTFEPNWTHIP